MADLSSKLSITLYTHHFLLDTIILYLGAEVFDMVRVLFIYISRLQTIHNIFFTNSLAVLEFQSHVSVKKITYDNHKPE